MGSSRSDGSGKERLKWTQELHDLFEKAVTMLGGPDIKEHLESFVICKDILSGATPKGILKAMSISGLTIYHVKSHLQKYRLIKFVPETPNKNKCERRNIFEMLPNFMTTSGAQLKEALQVQLEVQKRLSDQHEVQRNLKVKLEAQERFLERICEECKSQPNVGKLSKSFSPISLPSLCEDSDSNAKEFESDSDVDKNEIRSHVTFRAPKRLRLDEDDIDIPQRYIKYASIKSYSCAQQRMLTFKGSNIAYQSPEIGFPWTVTAYCQSPLMPASSYGSFN